jgi:hypothetical protein
MLGGGYDDQELVGQRPVACAVEQRLHPCVMNRLYCCQLALVMMYRQGSPTFF